MTPLPACRYHAGLAIAVAVVRARGPLSPMPYELTWEPGGVLRRYLGDVTVAERQRSFEAICGDARFDSLRYTITSYLDVTRYEVDRRATEEIAAMHIAPLATNPHIAIAAVAVNRVVIDAIEHFISLDFIGAPYRVFDTEKEARAWLAGLNLSSRPRLTRRR